MASKPLLAFAMALRCDAFGADGEARMRFPRWQRAEDASGLWREAGATRKLE